MLKKTTIAILGLAASSFASAGTMGPICVPGNVTVPCEGRQWDLGAYALYLKPTNSADLGYESFNSEFGSRVNAFNSFFPFERFETFRNYRSHSPKFGWAYQIVGSYHYRTGNDVTMSLVHFDNSTNRGLDYSGFTSFAATPLAYNVHRENRFDQVNLVLGQHVDMGDWTHARFYGGMQYAKIRVDERNTYGSVPLALIPQGISAIQQYRDADVGGAGPVVGIDYTHSLFRGFGLTANAASSILYGSTRFADGYVLGPTGLVQFNRKVSAKIVVPSLEAKLGLSYVHECPQGILSLEGGYQALNYFDVFATRGRAGFDAGRTNTTNFGLYGPYFGAKWVGNA